MVAQQCECTENHQAVCLEVMKVINFMSILPQYKVTKSISAMVHWLIYICSPCLYQSAVLPKVQVHLPPHVLISFLGVCKHEVSGYLCILFMVRRITERDWAMAR
jgi:hypothetical protein